MSVSTDAILAYGYDLGEFSDIVFVVDGEVLDDDSVPYWFDEDDPDRGFVEQVIDALLAAARIEGKVEDYDLYADSDEAAALLGVDVVEHCSDRAPKYLLAAVSFVAVRGYPELVDPSPPSNADERLSWALGVLGIRPNRDKPTWLLASYWGA